MRIAVLGVGSIGGVLLGALSDTDCDLVAISRGSSANNLSSMGLVLYSPEGPIEAIPPERFETFDSESGPVQQDSQTTVMRLSFAVRQTRHQYSRKSLMRC